MKILFDTNVILDVLLDREPFALHASYLMSKVERSEITGFLCATTITTIHYSITKSLGPKEAIQHIRALLSLFEVAPVTRVVMENALNPKFTNFEDSVLHEAACHAGAEYIVTRNISEFKNSRIPACTPDELIHMMESIEK